jgi:hypothetical protein
LAADGSWECRVDDGVLGLVRLHVEMSAMPRVTVKGLCRHGLLIRHAHRSRIMSRWITWFLDQICELAAGVAIGTAGSKPG